ncbi:MAG: IS5/IS1182 family transposase, partial [Synergistaceae bacterium]|nr:IS5/IS1182 family transposase [Synergistaceae bacterium]
MDNITRIENLSEAKYLVLFGVRKPTFDAMLAILERAYEEPRKRGGRRRKLSVLDMLVILLGYYHDYRTMENIAFEYGVHKQRISEAVAWA